jgi:pyruvate,water dikinase
MWWLPARRRPTTSWTSWPARRRPGSRDAILAYLDKYGMRCVGEIDITRPRWSERPTARARDPRNIKIFEPGAFLTRVEQGRQEAQKKEQDVLSLAGPCRTASGKPTRRQSGLIDRGPVLHGTVEYPEVRH